MTTLDRRTFMALGLGAVAWACGRGATPRATPAPQDALSVLLTMPGLALGDTRMGFAIAQGQTIVTPKEVAVGLYGPDRELVGRVPTRTEEVTRGLGGAETQGAAVNSLHVFRYPFDRPGVWSVDVRADGQRAQASFQVVPDDSSPRVGEPAIAVGSPTVLDPLGVDPICTRKPPCAMHQLSLADALDQGKPVVLNFGTPRFCTSRTCGPVVDIIEKAKQDVGDAANFVHVEVWRDDETAVGKPDGYAPAFRAWKLNTEPYTFFIGPDGTVVDRWAGGIGQRETSDAVKALVDGTLKPPAPSPSS